jgi:flagellar FliL protein
VAGGDNEGSKGGGGGLIGIVVVTLLSLGLGGAFGMFLGSAPASTETGGDKKQKEHAAKAEKDAGSTITADSKVVALTPIVVNLAAPADSWIRIEASVLLEGMEHGGDALAAQLAEDFVAYLRTATLDQFEGPSGFQNLREDFLDRATIRDHEHIKDVIIHGVVVE